MSDTDGSLTCMVGWPIPCFCTDLAVLPADVRQAWLRQVVKAIPPVPHRSLVLSAPLSRSGL
jgi:hypothetical protein